MLAESGSLVGLFGHGTTKSLYVSDPDGLEFEVCWLLPLDRITDEIRAGMAEVPTRPLDPAGEIERFGADTRGGIGVSAPAAI